MDLQVFNYLNVDHEYKLQHCNFVLFGEQKSELSKMRPLRDL